MTDMVNNPPHYGEGTYQVINVIEAWGLGYRLGNVIKYVARAHRKGRQLEDLKKAAWYLNREIEALEAKQEEQPYDWRAAFRKFDADLREDWAKESSVIAEDKQDPCTFRKEPPHSTYIAVYTDISKSPFSQYAVQAHHDWTIETLAGLVATMSKEWACGTFGLAISPAPETHCLKGSQSVEWLLKTYPPERYNYYLRKIGLLHTKAWHSLLV